MDRTKKKNSAATVKAGSRGSRKGTTKSSPSDSKWILRLYVAGQSPRALAAFSNLKRFCEAHLAGQYKIEVVDLLKQPELAEGDQIVALPTLVRKLPEPIKRVVGDLSNTERIMVGMDLKRRKDL